VAELTETLSCADDEMREHIGPYDISRTRFLPSSRPRRYVGGPSDTSSPSEERTASTAGRKERAKSLVKADSTLGEEAP
jgi:hypothetical protein